MVDFGISVRTKFVSGSGSPQIAVVSSERFSPARPGLGAKSLVLKFAQRASFLIFLYLAFSKFG